MTPMTNAQPIEPRAFGREAEIEEQRNLMAGRAATYAEDLHRVAGHLQALQAEIEAVKADNERLRMERDQIRDEKEKLALEAEGFRLLLEKAETDLNDILAEAQRKGWS